MKSKFKPGDRVRVRDWDELVSKWAMQYEKIPDMAGPNVNGLYFNPKMRKYCGQVFTVSWSGDHYNLQDDNGNVLSYDEKACFQWAFNDDMLEPVADMCSVQIEPTVSFNELFAL